MVRARSIGACVLASVVTAFSAAGQVSWTGGGDGTSWNEGANWSTGVAPTGAQTVTINVGANPTVVIGNGVAAACATLTSAETIRIDAGGALAVGGAAAMTNDVVFMGGVVNGGTWTFTGAGNAFTFPGQEGTITGATLNNALVLDQNNGRVRIGLGTVCPAFRLTATNASVGFAPGYTLNAPVTAEGTDFGQRAVELNGVAGTLTIGAGGSITLASGATVSLLVGQSFWFGGAMTLVNNAMISSEAGGHAMTVSPQALANTGTLRAINGGVLTINPAAAWTNGGTISATGNSTVTLNGGAGWVNTSSITATNSTLNLDGDWENNGTVTVTNSTLNLAGMFSTADIGTLTRTGGTVNLTGTLDNTAATLALNAATGSWNVNNGTITGGSVTLAAGSRLSLTGMGTLDGVAYGGELVLDQSNGRVRVGPGTTFTAIRLAASNAAVGFPPGYTVNFPITAEGMDFGSRAVEMNGLAGTLTIGAGGSVTLASGSTLSMGIGPGFWFGGAMTLINNATIGSESSGQTLNMAPQVLTNPGTIRALNGGLLTFNPATPWANAGTVSASNSTLTFNGDWDNNGTIAVTNSTLNLAGTFNTADLGNINRTGGTVNLIGAMDNTGSTLALNAATGSWNMNAGTITGGSVTLAAGSRLLFNGSMGTLNGVAYGGELLLDQSNGRVRIGTGTTTTAIRLAASNAAVGFPPGYTVNFPITAEGMDFGSRAVEMNGTPGTLTIGAGGSITLANGAALTVGVGPGLWFGGTMTLINQGLVASESGGQTLNLMPGSLTTSGTLRAANGGVLDVSALSGAVGSVQYAGAGAIELEGAAYSIQGISLAAGQTLTLLGGWTATGNLTAAGGTVNAGGAFDGATAENRLRNNGGTVNITGAANNAGNTLTLNNTTGTWTLLGGHITGGSVQQLNGQRLVIGSTDSSLTDVAWAGELLIDVANARVRFFGSTSCGSANLAANNTSIGLVPGTVLGFDVTFSGMDGGIRALELNGAVGTLTIPAARTVRSLPGSACSGLIGPLWFGGNMTLTVNGTVAIEAPNHSISVAPFVLTNYSAGTGTLNGGTWVARDGTIFISLGTNTISRYNADITVSGTLGGFESLGTQLRANLGTLRLDNDRDVTLFLNGETFTNSGTLRLGPGCTLNLVDGSYTQTGAATLSIDLGGESEATGFGRLIVQNTATLAGEMRAQYVNGFARVCGQLFQFFDSGSRIGGWDMFDLPPIDATTVVIAFYNGPDAQLTVTSIADFNQDGFLNGLDFDEFVVAFEAGDPLADFDRDGFITGLDFDEFVVRFEAGC